MSRPPAGHSLSPRPPPPPRSFLQTVARPPARDALVCPVTGDPIGNIWKIRSQDVSLRLCPPLRGHCRACCPCTPPWPPNPAWLSPAALRGGGHHRGVGGLSPRRNRGMGAMSSPQPSFLLRSDVRVKIREVNDRVCQEGGLTPTLQRIHWASEWSSADAEGTRFRVLVLFR